MARSRHERNRRRSDAIALSGAIAIHLALFEALWSVPLPPRDAAPLVLPVDLEVRFANEPTETGAPAASESGALPQAERPRSPAEAAPARDPAHRTETALDPQPILENSGEASADTERAGAGALGARTPGRTIDIWLRDPASRAALLQGIERPAPPPPPSVGLLREGLVEADAARGLARSSAAISASYEAARYAPASGIAIFELRANANGLVQTVLVSSAPSDHDAWQRVADHLKSLLQNRRLRVPPGSRGLLTRLRIERGQLAVPLSERNRTERKPALGQAPQNPKEEWDYSTRAAMEQPGRLSPTLGGGIGGSETAYPTRVVVLDERAL